jgi:DNA helicase-2/ATP-dependent DNA helicase PcrA
MPIPPAQIAAAQAVQHKAAHDGSTHVRLVAGPGSGKSAAIGERVKWLLGQGINPEAIFAVSFTRASSADLRDRIRHHCTQNGQPAAAKVQVSTLHSLALRVLRKANLLSRYPANPLVLGDWELENVFDAEYAASGYGSTKKRRKEVRVYHEAFWSTGQHLPANYIPPDPPITDGESAAFLNFHGPRTQTYSCVLPGEIVRQCVEEVEAGNLNPAELLGIEHLIIDEFQDLNPMDLAFIYAMIDQGVQLFIAGDDDQSIYSFRFAMPEGIQKFPTQYPQTGQHTLNGCFRCMPNILAAGDALMKAYPSPNRIPKSLSSLYKHCTPNANGIVHRWRFGDGRAEATAVAQSCSRLIAAGVTPRDILILVANRRVLLPDLVQQLDLAKVPFDSPRAEGFTDTDAGHFIHAVLRVVCEPDDYMAHRLILGQRNGVGITTCHKICDAVIQKGLNYRDIFYKPLPTGVFSGVALKAVNNARGVCAQISQWQKTDTLQQRLADITALVSSAFAPNDVGAWQAYAALLPAEIQLSELADYVAAESDEHQALVLASVYERLSQPVPETHAVPSRVRLLSMHGAKGLSARVVFIPGLEDQVLPGPWRVPYPGLVLEAARLLYVSITRARAACIVSLASRRMMNGGMTDHASSRFASKLNGPFTSRMSGLTANEAQAIVSECNHI